ncbi:MAG: glucosamine-6-phosphate deaminase [Verrucomicrobiales bacterium]|jgi:glucosamine-6-phosphate deaminase|nr:glucosamine-6-phosphate deaminase [Verrucomicrobiales bacterium]
MEIIIRPTPEECASIGGRIIANLINGKPNAVLGLATGSTPIPLYSELVRMHKEEGLSFSEVTSFNLDEYIGLSGEHPCSYQFFMNEELFGKIDIKSNSAHIPNGEAQDIQSECLQYEQAIRSSGGIDLQVLGIGSDGHIGFNEPGSSLGSRTRIKTLTGETIEDNARFFDNPDQVPRHCITMGVGTIMDSETVLLFAFGEGKADIISKAVEGPVSAMVPASILQLHPNVKVIVDEAAGSNLANISYYKEVYENKPDWQA